MRLMDSRLQHTIETLNKATDKQLDARAPVRVEESEAASAGQGGEVVSLSLPFPRFFFVF